MQRTFSVLLFLSFFMLFMNGVQSQELWVKLDNSSYLQQKKELYYIENVPNSYQLVRLNIAVFQNQLKGQQNQIIKLPNQEGGFERFVVRENSNFEIGLQEKFPTIKSYTAQGIDDPTAIAKISLGTDGMHAAIFYGDKNTLYIDSFSKDNKDYMVYNRKNLDLTKDEFTCKVEETTKKQFSLAEFAKNPDDNKLRTYRLAIACSGEYAQFHLGQQNISTSATEEVKKTAILSAMNTSLTRVNGVFENDLSVKLILVNDNDKIIFLDSATDNITDDNANTAIDEVQVICDNQIGSNNYDIGHLFSTSGGTLSGLASLGSVCINGQKAKGVTGLGTPIGDVYDIDLVIHELGHQFGATHTQNNDCNRSSQTAVEPGSGSTIMGYAGICNPNVQSGNANGNSDDYFHAVSIAQMWNILQTSGNCGVETDTNNNAPTASAGSDFSIPKSTPFKLTGSATDADGLNSLTYNWEQIDNEIGTMPPLSSNSVGPVFRSLPSKTTPTRYFPALETIVAGNTSTTWEVLPSVARELNFSFLVRDNNAGGGSSARDDTSINIIDTEPFTVSTPIANSSWDVGTSQVISWNKGTTDIAPINCSLVNIKLSVDGGLTFPVILAANAANDGSETIIIPNNVTSSARILIEGVDHIFYNVNDGNFSINSTEPTFIIKNESGSNAICNTGNDSVQYELNFDFVNGFSETVMLSSSGEPNGSSVSFSPTTINSNGNVTMTVSNLNGLSAQDYQINVLGTSISKSQNIDVDLKLTSSTFNDVTLLSPSNGATGISLIEELEWDADSNALSYDVEIATDQNFTDVVSSGNVITNSYVSSNLSGVTTYFWRVKPKNDCGEGAFSSPFSFTTLSASYCASTFTDETNGTEHILNVTFAGINNDSGNDTEDGYQDFTSINTNVFRGQTKEISVQFDTGGFQDHCYVFIDWNQDFNFDKTSERYDLGSKTEDVATATFSIKVPDDARLGATRMRVVLEYDDPTDGFGDGACDSDHLTEWGETEDYTVTVVDPNLNPNNFSIISTSESCVDENDGNIQILIDQIAYTYQVNITGPDTNVDEGISGTNYLLTGLSPGKYEICVFTQQLNSTQCFEVFIEESSPVSLKLSSSTMEKKYSFNIDQGTPPYTVFLNDEVVGVSSEKNFDLEINGTGKLELKTSKDCEGIFQKSIGDIVLLQNPVDDFVHLILPFDIKQENVDALIFDVNGKLIFKKTTIRNQDKLIIPIQNLAKGLYILKLSIENTKPLKIIKR